MPRPRGTGRGRAPKSNRRPARAAAAQLERVVEYKVIELTTVDEHTLQRALNDWAPRGWCYEGVQFAMRESSRRPSMAFIFFTRAAPSVGGLDAPGPAAGAGRPRPKGEARRRLERMAHQRGVEPGPRVERSEAWARLEALATQGDGE